MGLGIQVLFFAVAAYVSPMLAVALIVIFVLNYYVATPDTASTGKRAPEKKLAPCPPAAATLARRLGLDPNAARRVVTVASSAMLLSHGGSGGGGGKGGSGAAAGAAVELDSDGVAALRLLVQVADVCLLTRVADQAEQVRLTEAMLKAGVAVGCGAASAAAAAASAAGPKKPAAEKPVAGDNGAPAEPRCPNGSPAAQENRPTAVPVHKLLFHSTEAGKVAMVRQLKPALHLDADPATLRALKPHLNCVAQVAASASAPVTSNPEGWRVLPRAWFLATE